MYCALALTLSSQVLKNCHISLYSPCNPQIFNYSSRSRENKIKCDLIAH